MTHCDVVALVAESKPLELRLRQCFCKFSTGIDKYGSDVIRTVVNVAQSNPFSVFCNNYVEISVCRMIIWMCTTTWLWIIGVLI